MKKAWVFIRFLYMDTNILGLWDQGFFIIRFLHYTQSYILLLQSSVPEAIVRMVFWDLIRY